ncbi:hypothetical protein M513_11921 [Trichuris suis]|uniref:ISXO2-like transposase domain-containing protein n=1 Tax=Trichuris suis TaxID=68888 RepID=A0A085LQG8_9BILA|nr:hypothetical protein M513_11921 [Trichuris suis]
MSSEATSTALQNALFPTMQESTAVQFLQEHGVLHRERNCSCGNPMSLSVQDGGRPPRWRCHKASCGRDISVRKGTWFEGTKVLLGTAVQFIFNWTRERTTCTFCAEHLSTRAIILSYDVYISSENILGMPPRQTVKWNRLMREVAAESINRKPCVIGGERLTVELDESLFSKRKGRQQRSALPPAIAAATIESLWAQIKRRNKIRCGTRRTMLDSYFSEFMWRRRLQPGDVLENVLHEIAAYWPPE